MTDRVFQFYRSNMSVIYIYIYIYTYVYIICRYIHVYAMYNIFIKLIN